MKKKKQTKTCSTTRLSQRVYKRDFCSHVFANPDRHIYIYKQKKKVIIVVTLILLTNHQFYQNIEVIICTQFDN